jgi:hypothetical protein
MRLFTDEPSLVWKAQAGLLAANARYIGLMLLPGDRSGGSDGAAVCASRGLVRLGSFTARPRDAGDGANEDSAGSGGGAGSR